MGPSRRSADGGRLAHGSALRWSMFLGNWQPTRRALILDATNQFLVVEITRRDYRIGSV